MTVHRRHMTRALDLAQAQHGRTGSNPAVGCVILDDEGRRLSEGATGDGGRPHAEQIALQSLALGAASGGTAYVTLEPCRERSTDEAACSQRLIDAGLERVFIATLDRHPKGSGGLDRLRAAGVKTETGLLQEEADALYTDFFTRLRFASR